jgi:hypothetical protein
MLIKHNLSYRQKIKHKVSKKYWLRKQADFDLFSTRTARSTPANG